MDLQEWISVSTEGFLNLSADDRFRALTVLLNHCDANEQWRWQQSLTERFRRDLISWLPLEISIKILSMLDARSLFHACQVCRTWRLRTSSCTSLWRRQAKILGGQEALGQERSLNEWKANVRNSCLKRAKLKGGKAFEQQRVFELTNPATVVAMDYHAGYYATACVNDLSGSFDESGFVSLYAWPGRKPLHVFKHSRGCVRASALKLLFPDYVCVGYLDGYVTTWNIETGQQLDLACHSGAIYSLAADKDLNILVSGSADRTSVIWNLKTGSRLNRLASQMHWIVAVKLQPDAGLGFHVLVTMSKEFLHTYCWKTTEDLRKLTEPNFEIPLKTQDGGYQELRDVFFTPGVHVQGSEVTFVRQMPLFETHTIGDADVVTLDLLNGQLKRSIHINQKLRKLLAVGSRFALALLPYVDQKYKNLAVIDLQEKRIIGGCTVPHSRATTPDFAQILIGDKSWLDGMSPSNTQRCLVAALATQDSSICFVHWN